MKPTPVVPGHNRILVIDDNPEIHADFRKVLAPPAPSGGALDNVMSQFFGPKPAVAEVQSEFQLDSAFQGKEGLDMVVRAIAEGRPYAMAFVDVRMPPGWDGVGELQDFDAVERFLEDHQPVGLAQLADDLLP